MSSFQDERLSSMLRSVGAGTKSPDKNYATVSMLKDVRIQLEEYLQKQIKLELKEQLKKSVGEKSDVVSVGESRTNEEAMANLGRDFNLEKDDQKRFREVIGRLMWETKKLTQKVEVLERRIEEIERGCQRVSPPIPVMEPLHVTCTDSAGANEMESGNNEDVMHIEAPRPQQGAPGDNLDTELENAGESIPALAGGSTRELANDRSSDVKSEPSRISIGVIHGKSPVAGRFLAFSCLCGVEFDTYSGISQHIREETTNVTVQGTSTSNSGATKVKLTSESPKPTLHAEDPLRHLHCLCGIDCRDELALFQHIKYYTNRKLFSCKSCRKKFRFVLQLKAHLRKVHKANLSSSGRQISLTPNYSTYKKARAGKYKKCQDCAVSFTNAKKLADHQNAVHHELESIPMKVLGSFGKGKV